MRFGDELVEQVSSYKYLGITLDECLSFNMCYEELGLSASRALGAVISKCSTHKGLGFKTYDKVIQSCVFSILDYGAEVTGLRSHQRLDDVQNRAARYFLGVNRFCPLPCLNLETGWLTGRRRRHLCVLRYYNRLLNMNENRIPRKIFFNTKNNEGSWANQVKHLMEDLVLEHFWDSGSPILKDVSMLMVREKCKEELYADVDQKPKLRTYKTLCTGLLPAAHVKCPLDKGKRSLLSQLRCGTLHLRIELGRFRRELLRDRLCGLCEMNCVESEQHFIFECPAYNQDRQNLVRKLNLPAFPSDFKHLFRHPFVFGGFVQNIWAKRINLMNS